MTYFFFLSSLFSTPLTPHAFQTSKLRPDVEPFVPKGAVLNGLAAAQPPQAFSLDAPEFVPHMYETGMYWVTNQVRNWHVLGHQSGTKLACTGSPIRYETGMYWVTNQVRVQLPR